MKTFCIIGAGNVATHLASALSQNGLDCLGVYSRTEAHAGDLAKRLQTAAYTKISELPKSADCYLLSVSDQALPSLAEALNKHIHENACLLHTAGSISVDVLAPHPHRGVLYPLQTFSKSRVLDMSRVPIFTEAMSPETQACIDGLTQKLQSQTVIACSGNKRKQLHLAAVFACNFVNNMYHSAGALLEAQGFPNDALLPLIEETYQKALAQGAAHSQTGPAMRDDTNVMQAHLKMLNDSGQESMAKVYQAVSANIAALQHKKGD